MNSETFNRIQFRGHLDLTDNPCPVLCTIEYDEYDSTVLGVELLFLGPKEYRNEHFNALIDLLPNYLKVHSDEEARPSAEILGIHRRKINKLRAEIEPLAVQIGLTEEPLEADQRFFIHAKLAPSGIVVTPGTHQLTTTGESTFKRYKSVKDKKIEITSEFGTLEVAETYSYYSSKEFGNNVRHSIQRASVTGEILVQKGQNLLNVNEQIRDIIGGVCEILSLCYKQTVDYYEIEYCSLDDLPQHKFETLRLRRVVKKTVPKINIEELVEYRDLVDGGLDHLWQSYTNHKNQSELSRAIRFLASSYQVDDAGTAYFLAYSALDLTVKVCRPDTEFLVKDRNKWEKVAKKLREHIRNVLKEHGEAKVSALMIDKLPELRRTPGAYRIIEACDELGVDTSDLWPREGLEQGIKTATNMRNDLFHAALSRDDSLLMVNAVRIRSLVERLLLKELNWPDEKIWRWHNQLILGLNDSET